MKPLIERLQSLGYAVSRNDATATVSENARVVLALWSANARNSARVAAEAAHALDKGKLVQARLDAASVPVPFGAYPAANLGAAQAEYGALEDALARAARGEAPTLANGKTFGSSPACVGTPRSVAFATFATLCAFAGAISAMQNGAMSAATLQAVLWGCIGVSALCALLSGVRRFMIWRAD